jgi:indolepyruvate ferredoxin oxidoreductase beta subunit
MTARPTMNVLLTGVGGQGVVLASYVLSHVAIGEGYDVKQSEVHGMAQRGGSVVSHFRFGDKVWSPLVPVGQADLVMAFEALEGLRHVQWLKPDGVLVYNALRINPSPVAAGLATYPSEIDSLIKKAWPSAKCVNANSLAQEAGTVKAANVAMLGAISPTLPFDTKTWERIIREAVPPKTIDVNLQAFRLGAKSAAASASDCKTR